MPRAEFQDRLAANQNAVAEYVKQIADYNAAQEKSRQALKDQFAAIQKTRDEELQAIHANYEANLARINRKRASGSATGPQVVVSSPDSPAIPIPANAWSAQPDPLAVPLKIRPTLKHIFSSHARDLLYPTQPSNYVCVGNAFDGPETKATDIHEAWNLQTIYRTGFITGQLSLKDPAMSPNGQYLAGCVTGGPGQATTYEVWSFKLNKRVQTLADAPMIQQAKPIAVGFLGEDQIVTLQDDVCVWNIRTGALARRIHFDGQRGNNEAVAISPGGKLVAFLGTDGILTMIDTVNGKSLGQTAIPSSNGGPALFFGFGTGLAFSPDGSELALLNSIPQSHIVVWSVTKGNVLANFNVNTNGGANIGRGITQLVWLPSGDGWLVHGSQIVDRATGVLLYEVPEHREDGAMEYGPRTVVDASHILFSFRSFENEIGFETFPLPADLIAKARAAATPRPNQ